MMPAWLSQSLPPAVVLISLLAAILIFAAGEARQRFRIVVNLLAAVIKFGLVVWIGLAVMAGNELEFRFDILPRLELVLRADALSVLFTSLSALLWLVTTVYAVAYLERDRNRARFFGFFSLCVTSTMGIAMAGNLFTFFLFYELLTLATWPLVVHSGSREALASGRLYLRYTLSGGVLLLAALVWIHGLAGDLNFTPGGFLAVHAQDHGVQLRLIFVLLVAGLGVKAALFPLHRWLPAAMVAPAPVSALLHAVAVVKAGAFGLIRVIEDIYGHALVVELGLQLPLLLLAGYTIVHGSVIALRQTNLKLRLAWSTVSQVSYILLGVTLGGQLATIGGMVHLVHQGLMKITLFFCAGIFALLLGAKSLDQLDGMARRLPLVSVCFTVAALGMIGIPPIAGFISKWYLASGAIAVGQPWVVAVLIASTLLNAAYFLPVIQRIWMRSPPADAMPMYDHGRLVHASLVGAAVVTAGLSLVIGLLAAQPYSPLAWVISVATEYLP